MGEGVIYPRWIETASTLPEEGQNVLCYWGKSDLYGEAMGVATYAGSDRWHEPDDDEDDFRPPLFWMPLPPPPTDRRER